MQKYRIERKIELGKYSDNQQQRTATAAQFVFDHDALHKGSVNGRWRNKLNEITYDVKYYVRSELKTVAAILLLCIASLAMLLFVMNGNGFAKPTQTKRLERESTTPERSIDQQKMQSYSDRGGTSHKFSDQNVNQANSPIEPIYLPTKARAETMEEVFPSSIQISNATQENVQTEESELTVSQEQQEEAIFNELAATNKPIAEAEVLQKLPRLRQFTP